MMDAFISSCRTYLSGLTDGDFDGVALVDMEGSGNKIPKELLASILFQAFKLKPAKVGIRNIFMSFSLVDRAWKEAAELAAILYANTNGIEGLLSVSQDIGPSRSQLISLMLRQQRSIERWHSPKSLTLEERFSCKYFVAKLYVRPGLTALDVTRADQLLFEDYACIAGSLPNLREFAVERSLNDKAMCLISKNLQELEILNLYHAVQLTEKAFTYMKGSFSKLKSLQLPYGQGSLFSKYARGSPRLQASIIGPICGSFPLLKTLRVTNVLIDNIAAIACSFPLLINLELSECGLCDADALTINRGFSNLRWLDISYNNFRQGFGLIALVSAQDKGTKIYAKGSVRGEAYKFCQLLKRDYPNFFPD